MENITKEFPGVLALDDVLHEDARRDDVVRVDLAQLDELLDLGDGDTRGGRLSRA